MRYYGVVYSNELYHYGKKGMRWGVRNPAKYYAKKARKLRQLDKKIHKLNVKNAKFNYKSSKKELSALNGGAYKKSVKYKIKANKAAYKAEKAKKKGIKVYNKLMKKMGDTDLSQVRQSDIETAKKFAAVYLNAN